MIGELALSLDADALDDMMPAQINLDLGIESFPP